MLTMIVIAAQRLHSYINQLVANSCSKLKIIQCVWYYKLNNLIFIKRYIFGCR